MRDFSIRHRFDCSLCAGLALLLACYACSSAHTPAAPAYPPLSSSSSPAGAADTGFSLRVLPETFLEERAAGEFSLSQRSVPGGVEVSVLVEDAQILKALYFELRYDARRFTPLTAEASGMLSPGGELLELAHTSEPGRLQHGQVLTHWPARAGFAGDVVLATVRFAASAFVPSVERETSTAPDSALSSARLEIDPASKVLHWYHYSQGDYDQNGLTNISDLTPLGANFAAAGPFNPATVLSGVDGDANGLINIADVTPIGANFGRRVERYRLYVSTEEYYPQSNSAPELKSATYINEQIFADGEQLPGIRREFLFHWEFLDAGTYYWVRPLDGDSAGTPSNAVLGTGNEAPLLTLLASPTSGAVPLDVEFTAEASDVDGSIALFEWDFDGDRVFDASSASDAVISHTYSSDGTFIARARVTDDQGARALRSIKVIAGSGANLPPIAQFSATPETAPAGSPIALDYTGTHDPDGAIVLHELDLEGDGEIDVSFHEQVMLAAFVEPGTYTIEYRVTDNGGASTSDFAIVLITPP